MRVLQDVYIEQNADDRLRDEALRSGISKGELFRRYLRAGARALKSAAEPGTPPTRPPDAPLLMLRTVHVGASLWEWIRTRAFDAHVLQSEYVRWCLDLGMQRGTP
jgi:hypothetical protein